MVFTKGKGSADGRLGRNGVAGSAGQAGAAAAPAAAAAGGKKRSAVEDVLAALSLEGSEGSLGEPSKHMRQRSKMHEVEMDENNVVMHTRRGSTAVGVTPSDPSAIVDLFQEVESIGSTYIPEDETDDSTTDEEEGDSSCRTDPAGHAAASKNAAGDTGASGSQRQPSGGDSVSSGGSTTGEQQQRPAGEDAPSPAGTAAAAARKAEGEGKQQQQQQQQQPHAVGGALGKLWGRQLEEEQQQRQPQQPPRVDAPTPTTLNPALGEGGNPQQAPRPYWPSNAPAAAAAATDWGGSPAALGGLGGGAEEKREDVAGAGAGGGNVEAAQGSGEAGGAEGRVKLGLGEVRRTEGAWKLTDSETQKSAAEQESASEQQRQQQQQSQQNTPAVPESTLPESTPPAPPQLPKPGLPPSRGSSSSLQVNSVSESQQAPLRRKTSMGSFQKGMGESLTGRLRKQLDIPDAPKREIDTNIPIDQIKSLKYLAQGAMCVAYTALLNDQLVVLKTPLPDTSHAAVAANDLEVEMLLLKELHHDNIVSLLGAGYLPDGRRFVALEYLSGGTLSTVLREHRARPMSISKVLDLSLALCNALEYLHDVAVPGRIVCHRDLKPDNIGFMEDGTLKLIDFGLGKIIKRKFRVRAEKYHMTGGTGSLRYMAPEIADHQEYNEKGDVYSFSLIMWEMLTGTKPFLGLKRPDFYNRVVDQGERPPLDPEWPQPVQSLLESCWRTNLDERLSFREVAGILKVCAEEENQRTFTEEKRKSIRLSTRRSRLWTTTGARPDLDEISVDPQYKPKFKISSFLSTHHSTSRGQSTMEKLRGVAKGKGSSRRPVSDNTGKKARRATTPGNP